MQKQVYVVDVSSMFFRAFYAIRPLTSSKGVPVNAVYGFISMIIKLMNDKRPDHLVFCYDRKEPSFRKDLYEDYKANRSEMPEDLQVQMPFLKQVASLFGICDIELKGFEADDLIGTVANIAQREDYQVFIVSGDKDFCQLVNKNVFLYDTMKEMVYDESLVKEKHGVHPTQFIDFLAITGDTSDNIPGVTGVGPKGAQKLIEQFGTLEEIYRRVDEVESKSIREKLLASKEKALLSKTLVTIVCDAPVNFKIDDFKLKPFKIDELRSFLQELNFKTFEKTLLGDGQTVLTPTTKETKFKSNLNMNTETVTDNKPLESSSENIQILEWDSEKIQARLKANENFFSFFESPYFAIGFGAELYFNEISAIHLNFERVKWSGFDVKRVWTELGLNASTFNEVDFDLMLGCYVLRAADSTDYSKLSQFFLSEEFELSKELVGAARIEKIYSLFLKLTRRVKADLAEKDLEIIYEKLEKPLVPILFQMERKGIKIDINFLKNFSDELADKVQVLEKKIHEIAGDSNFNIGSPKQLGVILFEKLGLEAIKKTKTGYSTDNDVLEKLNHPIATEIISYRELTKLKSTYVDALPQLADQSAKLHTHLNQALTATGRISSQDPNLQNIPIKTEIGQRVRKAFVPSESFKLLSVDYSQIELRVLAHISEDAGLIRAFNDDLDIHSATASEVFGVPVKDVTKEQRRIAKAVNFGIAYGQGTYGLAESLGISRKESADIIERYFTKFSGIRSYIESTIKKAHELKYVETLFGRRRYIKELDDKNVMIRKFGERAAINAPIQGTASDLVKMAMIELQRELKVDMLLQVHDELIFEGPESLLRDQLPFIVSAMEGVAQLKVPLKVNYAIGANWDEAH